VPWSLGKVSLVGLGVVSIAAVGRALYRMFSRSAPTMDGPIDEEGCSRAFMSPNESGKRAKMPPDWIVLHDTEGGSNAKNIAQYFFNPATKLSSHLVVDNEGACYRVVDDDHVAWHAGAANPKSLGIELVAPVGAWKRSRDEWLREDTLLDVASDHVARWARRFSIPVVFLDAAALKRGERGITTHAEVTKALGGSHVDPGPNFPMDDFIDRVARRMPIV